jgi:Cu+-exporting ATPase
VLIKGPEILESTRAVDTVVLDKTGTVTEGRMTVSDVVPAEGGDPDELLTSAGAVEALSEHPVAQAIARAAAEKTGGNANGLPHATQFSSTAGGGVEALVDAAGPSGGLGLGMGMGTRVVVGRPDWLASSGVAVPAEAQRAVDRARDGGATVVGVAWNGAWRGFLALTDTVKESAPAAVADLRSLGLHPVLLTGDGRGAALSVARTVDIAPEDVVAEVRPEDKVAEVARLQSEGRVVAMVGDGVNDAAALARADLGLAMGTGTDAAIAASDITLVRGDLATVGTAVRLSRRTLRIIKQNLFWAFAYNVAAIPLAAAGLLNPMIAGATMAASSLIVVGNSLRLRRA